MWLLSTDRAELHFFTAPENVGRYAILSHVWDRAEQSFKELRKLEKRCAATGDVPRNLVGDKIRRCCELAEQHGYKWVWIDTCCIDKSSSAELSEAINSMYRYYSHSSICYAHLGDISCALPATFVNNLPDTDRQPPLGFAQSRCHQRGWTLQELIAAPFVVFVDREWGVLGSKAGFAEALQACTGISECLLKHEQQLNDFSIAQRMSWAAHRVTTRLEDEAYCLLGIFDIQMPTLYGEGRRAFQRLQEEIMKRSEDTTLFAWGCSTSLQSLARTVLPPHTPGPLFAHSPAVFNWPHCHRAGCTGVVFDYNDSTASMCPALPSSSDADAITLTVTPRGVLAHIPMMETDFATLADLRWTCNRNSRSFLLLSHRPMRQDGYPSYSICEDGEAFPEHRGRKAILAPHSSYVFPGDSMWRWRDVYLLHHQPSNPTSRPCPAILPMNVLLRPPQRFRFPSPNIQEFIDTLNGTTITVTGGPMALNQYALTFTANVGLTDDNVPTTFCFANQSHRMVVIQVGRCQRPAPQSVYASFADVCSPSPSPYVPWAPTSPRKDMSLWARPWLASQLSSTETLRCDGHDCFTDHVNRWPRQTKDFSFVRDESIWSLTIRLSCLPSPLDPNVRTLHASARWQFNPGAPALPSLGFQDGPPRHRGLDVRLDNRPIRPLSSHT